MVRRARGPLAPVRQLEGAAQAGDGRALQRLVFVHGRQQAGKALRQHRLASARWADQQGGMGASCCNFKSAAGGRLAFHVGHVGVGRGGAVRGRTHARPAFGLGRLSSGGGQKLRHHVQQVPRTEHRHARHQGGFFGAAGRQHQLRVFARAVQRGAHRQGAAHRPQLARQRQFAREFPARQPRAVNLPAGRQNAQCDGQVEPARILGQIGGRQVDGDALVVRERQAAVEQRRAHAFARLFHLHIGQADQGEAGQAVGQMHFNGDGWRGKAQQGAALYLTQSHARCSPSMAPGAPQTKGAARAKRHHQGKSGGGARVLCGRPAGRRAGCAGWHGRACAYAALVAPSAGPAARQLGAHRKTCMAPSWCSNAVSTAAGPSRAPVGPGTLPAYAVGYI